MQDSIVTAPIASWDLGAPTDASWQRVVEQGRVLYCPALAFDLEPGEKRYLDPSYSDEKRKSIYIRPGHEGVLGTAAGAADRAALLRMLKRYETSSMRLLAQLFPSYVGKMRAASTSLRPRPIGSGDAALSWRKDDTRLHVDAFPSNPTNGMRILRVFTNLGTMPRVWRVGPPFETMARYFMPRIRAPLPGSSRLLHALRITKRPRSAYDHTMLRLHDSAKADLEYQQSCEQLTFAFAPGSSWICFSDQVMHAAMSGQFMMEQTVHVPPTALAYPDDSPLGILERLSGKRLLREPDLQTPSA